MSRDWFNYQRLLSHRPSYKGNCKDQFNKRPLLYGQRGTCRSKAWLLLTASPFFGPWYGSHRGTHRGQWNSLLSAYWSVHLYSSSLYHTLSLLVVIQRTKRHYHFRGKSKYIFVYAKKCLTEPRTAWGDKIKIKKLSLWQQRNFYHSSLFRAFAPKCISVIYQRLYRVQTITVYQSK